STLARSSAGRVVGPRDPLGEPLDVVTPDHRHDRQSREGGAPAAASTTHAQQLGAQHRAPVYRDREPVELIPEGLREGVPECAHARDAEPLRGLVRPLVPDGLVARAHRHVVARRVRGTDHDTRMPRVQGPDDALMRPRRCPESASLPRDHRSAPVKVAARWRSTTRAPVVVTPFSRPERGPVRTPSGVTVIRSPEWIPENLTP